MRFFPSKMAAQHLPHFHLAWSAWTWPQSSAQDREIPKECTPGNPACQPVTWMLYILDRDGTGLQSLTLQRQSPNRVFFFLVPLSLAGCHLCLWHQGREEPPLSEPGQFLPSDSSPGSSQLSGSCSLFSCWMLHPLEPLTLLSLSLLFLFRLEYTRTQSPCPRSQPVPPTLVPPAPFIVCHPRITT